MRKIRKKRVFSSTQPPSSSSSSTKLRQTSILDHLKPNSTLKRTKIVNADFTPINFPKSEAPKHVSNYEETLSELGFKGNVEEGIGDDWEVKADNLLLKHFGFSGLKSFQKEALSAWVAHQDCLVLAATGSGKSLCFQLPALLTGKVVIVISPLISLMHDQCFKLANHGVSACFLGSGQPDSSVENRAIDGMFGIVYICPETLLRLIQPLQRLAENRGIALFAIDEVHCVSKWGHDFRPDYRRLSVLRKTFKACTLEFLKYDIPLMALTATATLRVREDILKSLNMSKETKIVVTSFFRQNLRFDVKHSTSSSRSYVTDFRELIDIYTEKKITSQQKDMIGLNVQHEANFASNSGKGIIYEEDGIMWSDVDDSEDDKFDRNDEELNLTEEGSNSSRKKHMTIEYLEDEVDVFQSVDDWDVACGEFYGQSFTGGRELDRSGSNLGPILSTDSLQVPKLPLEYGPTIIYVPTRKQTISVTKYLLGSGVKAAAYNAKVTASSKFRELDTHNLMPQTSQNLPKSHLRQVHKEFHDNTLQVVVATMAFGMGIDKPNVRRIIHYGWPQSLEAYYQEAGRAGRDGKLADCVMYANLSRVPTLLPSPRSKEQTKQAYRMLSDCHRYGMNNSGCRAKILVEYFGEDFVFGKCLLCDVCVNGAPELQNLKEEADIFMQIIAAYYGQSSFVDGSYEEEFLSDIKQRRSVDKPDIRMFISKIREQSPKYTTTDQLWWRGLARILEDKGYIKENDDKNHVQITCPEPTKLGLDFMSTTSEQPFYVYPEADMLLSLSKDKPDSTFAGWGKGWADPEIRRQRLGPKRSRRQLRQRKSRNFKPKMNTVRGRLTAKLSK